MISQIEYSGFQNTFASLSHEPYEEPFKKPRRLTLLRIRFYELKLRLGDCYEHFLENLRSSLIFKLIALGKRQDSVPRVTRPQMDIHQTFTQETIRKGRTRRTSRRKANRVLSDADDEQSEFEQGEETNQTSRHYCHRRYSRYGSGGGGGRRRNNRDHNRGRRHQRKRRSSLTRRRSSDVEANEAAGTTIQSEKLVSSGGDLFSPIIVPGPSEKVESPMMKLYTNKNEMKLEARKRSFFKRNKKVKKQKKKDMMVSTDADKPEVVNSLTQTQCEEDKLDKETVVEAEKTEEQTKESSEKETNETAAETATLPTPAPYTFPPPHQSFFQYPNDEPKKTFWEWLSDISNRKRRPRDLEKITNTNPPCVKMKIIHSSGAVRRKGFKSQRESALLEKVGENINTFGNYVNRFSRSVSGVFEELEPQYRGCPNYQMFSNNGGLHSFHQSNSFLSQNGMSFPSKTETFGSFADRVQQTLFPDSGKAKEPEQGPETDTPKYIPKTQFTARYTKLLQNQNFQSNASYTNAINRIQQLASR